MYWRSNSATGSPFLTSEPGLATFCKTRENSLDPPPPRPLVLPTLPGPDEPPGRLDEVDPSPSVPIVDCAADVVDIRVFEEEEELVDCGRATRLVADCIAVEPRDELCIPAELDTEPSAPTLPCGVEPPAVLVTVVLVARDVTLWLREESGREKEPEGPPRPKPERLPRS